MDDLAHDKLYYNSLGTEGMEYLMMTVPQAFPQVHLC